MLGFKTFKVGLIGFLVLAGAQGAVAQTPSAATKAALPSARSFAHFDAIASVSISDDGKHIAAVTSIDGKARVISVWETENLQKVPTVFGSSRMDIIGVQFLKNDRLYVTVNQLLDQGEFENDSKRGHLRKQYVTDLEGNNWQPILPEVKESSENGDFVQAMYGAQLISRLPKDPRHVLVQAGRQDEGDIFKVDVYSGKAERVQRQSEKYVFSFDTDGNLRGRQAFDFENGKMFVSFEVLDRKTGDWREVYRDFAKDRDGTSLLGWSKEDDRTVYVAKRGNNELTQIYAFNTQTKALGEPIFAHKTFDALGIRFDDGKIAGFRYASEAPRTYWIDDQLAALDARLKTVYPQNERVLDWVNNGTGAVSKVKYPSGGEFTITSWSDDKKHVIVGRQGPSLPPEYYLVTDGTKLTLLGKSRPDIDTKTLGESRFVQYKARDGLMIPAYLHLPSTDIYGPGPYKAIVLPHGGPWARTDFEWDFSGWTKYFTSRGYVVIEPMFRASENWGKKIELAGDNQWGLAMQDDLDDAAKWMIAQGYAAPDRVALHGYSYGGYAGFVAAVRPNGIFQCAVAGAGVASLARFKNLVRDQSRFQREALAPTMTGMNVIEETAKVSVPIFIYHGDRDVRVPIAESRNFAAGLKAAGKPFKYLELKDMGHQADKWTARDTETVLVEVESFLNKECKPGGL
jgi:dipeptidyl aminopeptidase/acylaminoacyl peptidase